jgi:RsiW-degrading membrane proteinase PrsW (M82 family)
MPIRSQKLIEEIDLKSDFRRILLISLVSIVLSIITYRLDNCFEESLFCTVLSVICTAIIGGLYFSSKSRSRR